MRITLTTDFGWGSPYVAALKGVILSMHEGAAIEDLTHGIPPQDIRAGAWFLAEATPWFPANTLHVAIVDPGVGSARKIVYARIGTQQYLAPDNGLLGLLAVRESVSTIVALSRPEFWLPQVSSTFHGRDIFAPVAARLSRGENPLAMGDTLEELTLLDWPEPSVMPQKISGEVTSVDSFGNLITNIRAEQLVDAPRGEELRITCGEHDTFGLFQTYSDQPPMTLIALIGSSGFLELAIVGDSAAAMLGEGSGSPVTVSW